MILTVTPNTGLDRVHFLPSLELGRRNQAARVVEAMGGKGCDVSLILAALGEPSLALGVVGGDTGRRIEARLREAGVESDLVWARGESRVNIVVIETGTGRHTTLCAEGLEASEEDFAALLEQLRRHGPASEAVALCGSLPATWPAAHYAELVRAAKESGRPVVVDASGEALRHALAGRPDAVKPNRHELESIAGPLSGRGAIMEAARDLLRSGAGMALVSLGDEGALAVTPGEAWYAHPLEVPIVNPAGAGDGMVAMLALGLARGWSVPDILRQAVAVATAITMTEGTAECPAADVPALVARVVVDRV